MKVMNVSKNSFKGYKNVIASDYNFGNVRLLHMAMQLDNNGKEDLNKLNEIRKLSETNKFFDDVVTFLYTRVENLTTLFYDNNAIFSGEELTRLSDSCNNSSSLFKRYEAETMKICTLIASLSKRIANSNSIESNYNGILKAAEKSTQVLSKYTNLKHNAMFLINSEIQSEFPVQKVAHSLNGIVSKLILPYFH